MSTFFGQAADPLKCEKNENADLEYVFQIFLYESSNSLVRKRTANLICPDGFIRKEQFNLYLLKIA